MPKSFKEAENRKYEKEGCTISWEYTSESIKKWTVFFILWQCPLSQWDNDVIVGKIPLSAKAVNSFSME